MATVYLAVARDSAYVARPLALKLIHPHLACERSFLDMFIDEARIASRLHHPNLCGVLDFGEANGSYYMTMEYLIGEPLSAVLRMLSRRHEASAGAPFSRAAAQIVADACEGLHSAHELRDDDGVPLDIVHRDVTPSNVFVTYEGPTRVVDFGVASAANCLHHTSTGTIKGKFGYMSPEHFSGHKLDRGADIWALGVVLWESIALRPLFRRANPSQTMAATLQGVVPALHELIPSVDPALSQIVGRALAKERSQQYASAAEMGADLQRFLASSGPPCARVEVAKLMKEAFPTGECGKRLLIKSIVESRSELEFTRPSHVQLRVSTPSPSDSHIVRKTLPALLLRTLERLRTSPPGLFLIGSIIALSALLWEMRVHSTPLARSPRLTASQPSAPPVSSGLAHSVPPRSAAVQTSAMRPSEPRPTAAPNTMPDSALELRASRPSALETDLQPLAPAESLARVAPASPHAAERLPAASASEPTDDSPKTEPPAQADPNAAVPTTRSTRRRAAAEPASRAVGRVSVVTLGDWAEIYHEGRLLGPTPAQITLPEGRQTLTLRPGSGGAPRNVVVMVRPDTTIRIRTDL